MLKPLPILLALTLSAGLLSAADAVATTSPFDAYTVVEASIATQQTDKGTTDLIKRYVIRNATVQQIGGRWFIVGKTPSADHVQVPGSDWDLLMIPLDEVRAMAGTASVAEFVSDRTSATKTPIGIPSETAAP